MVPIMTTGLVYGQNGKVSPDVPYPGAVGTGYSCRTVNTPAWQRSKLLIVAMLLIDLQLALAAACLLAPVS